MTIDADSIRARYPIFTPLEDETIDEYIGDAMAIVTPEKYLDLYERAVKVYTAHLLLVNFHVQLNLGGGLKSLEDESGGAVRIFSADDNRSWLESTAYGREFLMIQNSLLGSIGVNIY